MWNRQNSAVSKWVVGGIFSAVATTDDGLINDRTEWTQGI